MGLYLCVFDDERELDGVDVGSYADYNFFRNTVVELLEGGDAGSKFPTLVLHSDCDGEWNTNQCIELEKECRSIAAAFQEMPPVEFHSDWQKAVGKSLGLRPQSLYDSFIDVDGEPLLERMIALCKMAQDVGRPVLLQ